MTSLTATGSACPAATSAAAQIDMDRDFPRSILNNDDGDSESDGEGAELGSGALGGALGDASGNLPVQQQQRQQHAMQALIPLKAGAPAMQQLFAQHQPITLVNGQRVNQGFRKPEKTRWTAEEGKAKVHFRAR